MTEVEKMYENCNFEKSMGVGSPLALHPFTAEKQLHLIKWLSDKADYIDIHYDRYKGLFNIQTGIGGLYVCNEFEQALASRANIIWQDLTDTERTQIKEILE